jgi:hypothetical protein
MFANLLAKIGMKLLTETVIARVATLTLWELSKKTDSNLDNEVVKTVADALGVSLPDY